MREVETVADQLFFTTVYVEVGDCQRSGVWGRSDPRRGMAVSDTTELLKDSMIDPVTGEIIDQKDLTERLLTQAKEQGVSLVGPGGLLRRFTENVIETGLDAELAERLGHDRGGAPIAENMRNGTRTKTVLTEIGRVEIEVPQRSRRVV